MVIIVFILVKFLHNGIFTSVITPKEFANVEVTHNKKNQMQYNAVGNVFNWNGIMQLAIH